MPGTELKIVKDNPKDDDGTYPLIHRLNMLPRPQHIHGVLQKPIINPASVRCVRVPAFGGSGQTHQEKHTLYHGSRQIADHHCGW